jgi:hypothetical protein
MLHSVEREAKLMVHAEAVVAIYMKILSRRSRRDTQEKYETIRDTARNQVLAEYNCIGLPLLQPPR